MEIDIKIERKEEMRKETQTIEEEINNNNSVGGRRRKVSGGCRCVFYYGENRRENRWERENVGANEKWKKIRAQGRKRNQLGEIYIDL